MTSTTHRLGAAPSLGQILLMQGVVTERQLDNAIKEQRRTKQRLGAALISSGACTEDDIAAALARQLGLPHVEVTPELIDKVLVKRLGEEFLRKRCCLPLATRHGALRIAVADPFDVQISEDVQQRLNVPVLIEVSTQAAIQGVIDVVCDDGDRIETILADAARIASTSRVKVSESDLLSAEEIVNAFLAQGIRRGSADIHVEPEEDLLRVRFRIDGILKPGPMIPKEMIGPVLARLKILSDLDIAERRLPQDGRARVVIDERTFEMRVSILPTIAGESAVLRVLDSSKAIIPEEELGLEPETGRFLSESTRRPHGLFLVCGPTGSGKSTTLYSMLARVNALELKVITVEDPVEYRMPLIRQVQVHTEIGLTFAAGLRSILRQDPDVVLVGEIRDQETAEIALRAAMTGHLVLSTLHTNSAMGTVGRLIDMGVDPFIVTSTLFGALGQRLVRSLCSRCKRGRAPTAAERLEFEGLPSLPPLALCEPVGCAYCGDSGYRGRVGLHEILPVTPSLSRRFLDRLTEEELREHARSQGFRSFHQDGLAKVARGLTTLNEVRRVALDH